MSTIKKKYKQAISPIISNSVISPIFLGLINSSQKRWAIRVTSAFKGTKSGITKITILYIDGLATYDFNYNPNGSCWVIYLLLIK